MAFPASGAVRGVRRRPVLGCAEPVWVAFAALVLTACGGAQASVQPTAASPVAPERPESGAGTDGRNGASAGGAALQLAGGESSAGVDARGGEERRALDLEAVEPVPLASPGFEARVVSAVPAPESAGVRLKKWSESRNAITDTDAWFERHGVVSPVAAAAKVPAPLSHYRGERVSAALDHGDHLVFVYGGRYVLVLEPDKSRVRAAFDFDAYLAGPSAGPSEEAFVRQEVRWARAIGDTLLVSNGHRTYARSSRGKNAYLSAIAIPSGALRWRSAPLVSNAEMLVVRGGLIVTGYGFTQEPDSVIVLRLSDGRIAHRAAIRSAPEFIVEGDEGRLAVRAYDTDYVFALESR
jgi:hypothetical protein